MGAGFDTPGDLDHRGWIWVAGFLSLIYSLLCLAARAVGKWGLLWYDDIVLGISYIFAIVSWGLIFASLTQGLGVSNLTLSASAVEDAAQLYFASRVPFFISHCLSKLSILVFTRRIFAGDIYKENIIFGISYGVCILYGILGILLSSAGCRPEQALVASVNAVCDANVARWTVITILDGLSEIFVLAMPIWFISKNQLKASKKRIVVFVYCFRLVDVGFGIATTVSYFNFLKFGRDNIDVVPVVVWELVALTFSLISASFPCLRTFLWAFMSRGLMTMYGNTTTISGSDMRSSNRETQPSVQLRSMGNNKTGAQPEGQDDDGEPRQARLRPEWLEYRVDVRGTDARPKKKNSATGGLEVRSAQRSTQHSMRRSDDSDRMIIHTETTYRVESN